MHGREWECGEKSDFTFPVHLPPPSLAVCFFLLLQPSDKSDDEGFSLLCSAVSACAD